MLRDRVRQVAVVAALMGAAGWLVTTVASKTAATIAANEQARDAPLAIEMIGVATPPDVHAIVVCAGVPDL